MEKTNIPEILKACRKEVNMTQAQFAKTIGIKRSAYAYYESGRTRPKIETLRTIAKVYGLDVNTLISNEESNFLHQDNEQKINFDIKIDDIKNKFETIIFSYSDWIMLNK